VQVKKKIVVLVRASAIQAAITGSPELSVNKDNICSLRLKYF